MANHRDGATLVLLFDYDGTLAPIVAHPALAWMLPATRQLLAALSRRPRVAVGLVSGRSLRDVKRMVGLPGLAFAGTSGLEVEVGGRQLVPRGVTRIRALVADAGRRLASALEPSRGVWIEEKPLGLAVHYRAAPSRDAGALDRHVRRLLRPFGDALRIDEGPMVLEVVPNVGWTKGTAVRTLVARLAHDRAAILYAGDAPNDREAFRATAELGGVCIGVGALAPREARHRVRDPRSLTALLERLLV